MDIQGIIVSWFLHNFVCQFEPDIDYEAMDRTKSRNPIARWKCTVHGCWEGECS